MHSVVVRLYLCSFYTVIMCFSDEKDKKCTEMIVYNSSDICTFA